MSSSLLFKRFSLQRWELPTCFFTCIGWGSSRNVYNKSIVVLIIPSLVPIGDGLFLSSDH